MEIVIFARFLEHLPRLSNFVNGNEFRTINTVIFRA